MYKPDLTIEDINLRMDKTGRYIEGKAEVVITLKNNSKTLVYYMLKRPRTIEYDKISRTLSIGLYEKEPLPEITMDPNPIEPEQLSILPDTTLQWEYLIPVWMKKIMRSPGSRDHVEVLDISGVQKLVCTVAFHTSPFCSQPSDKGEEMLVALSKWGNTVSATVERTLTDH